MSMPYLHDPSESTCCRYVVFDAVGTLIEPNPSVAVAYQSISARYGSRLGVNEIGDRFRQAFRRSETDVFPDGPRAGFPWSSSDAIEIARWKWIVTEVVPDVDDIDRCFMDLWEHFAKPTSWFQFDDVDETLQTLRQRGYRLAIASNFDSRLHAVCDGHPTLRAIETRFVSSETGFRKPAPEFYSTVIARSGCPANEILMVGDDPEHDVKGPSAAGMGAILIDRRSKQPGTNSIQSLRQLLTNDF